MHILLVHTGKIPAATYGGTERVVYDLGQALTTLGHRVTFLVPAGSSSPFAPVLRFQPAVPLDKQIPLDVDVVHLNHQPEAPLSKPCIVTMHGNSNSAETALDRNTVFVSRDHARRFGSDRYVYNGLNWDRYGRPDAAGARDFFHFLGKAAWRVKNVKGAIKVCQRGGFKLKVLGGVRFNLNMGLRFTFDPRVSFEGVVDDQRKKELLPNSRGLVCPVLWHEPFGLAIIESLYFGAPVFGTPYGSLPELVTQEVGYLSNSVSELAQAMKHWSAYSRKVCSEYAATQFDAREMARKYLLCYEMVLNGRPLNADKPRLLHPQREKLLPWIS